MTEPKEFQSYEAQLALLEQRGMVIEDRATAEQLLRQVSYYRLSGYWHTMRKLDSETGESLDAFREGASFELTQKLYLFDEKLRNMVAGELGKIELVIRALLGHELGRIDPLLHLKPDQLGAPAGQAVRQSQATRYEIWLTKYERALSTSREDFVVHHKRKYGGKLPIWAAVEIMDWGMLSHLYGMAPARVRNSIALDCGLRAPQLESWLKSLNILRNYSAHHARVFNKVFDIKPRLSTDPRLAIVRGRENRAFTQLTLIQYLHHELELSSAKALPELLTEFPTNDVVPFSSTGAPEHWARSTLWALG